MSVQIQDRPLTYKDFPPKSLTSGWPQAEFFGLPTITDETSAIWDAIIKNYAVEETTKSAKSEPTFQSLKLFLINCDLAEAHNVRIQCPLYKRNLPHINILNLQIIALTVAIIGIAILVGFTPSLIPLNLIYLLVASNVIAGVVITALAYFLKNIAGARIEIARSKRVFYYRINAARDLVKKYKSRVSEALENYQSLNLTIYKDGKPLTSSSLLYLGYPRAKEDWAKLKAAFRIS